jgi:hypothetical protein
MPARLKVLALAAALAASGSGAAMAQYTCPPGYALYGGVCQPVPAPAYPSGPVSGAAAGGAAGAASGAAAAGPVGANALTGAPPAPVCAAGYTYYNGGCYPAP